MKIRSLKKELILQGKDGFTLIELVLTIIIVSILSAVVSLGLSGLSTARLDQAVNKVVGDLRYAQQLAISTQSRHGLTIGSATGYSLHINGVVLPLCDGETCIKDPMNLGLNFVVDFATYQQSQLAGVVITTVTPFCGGAGNVNPGDTIEFNSIGAPTDTGGTVLACTSTIAFSYSGSTRQITIAPNTGNLTY